MFQRGARTQVERAATHRPDAVAPPADVLADFDTQLMLQARSGNRDAANSLVHRNFDRISRYVARLVGNRGPVEDLTQEVFLQALSHAAQYQPTAKVATWLYRIATNICLNHLKQAHLRRTAPSPTAEAPDLPDNTELSPERQISLDELRQQVARAVNALPIKQRIALTLFEYEQCSYEQIAAVLDTSVESVRSLLMRARTLLRARLRNVI
jgi:RNA polymerase sigma-70 factor, ECF subfamily